MNELPKRIKLPHAIPAWVRQGAQHFITINCQARHINCLCRDDVAAQLLISAHHYEEIGRWYLWLMVVMPDHVHLIATFDLNRGVRSIVKTWKGYQKKRLRIEWQEDYFEHRLRNVDEFIEKSHYIRMNPVRKGLVALPEEWPYIIDRTSESVESGVDGRAKPPAEPKDSEQSDGSAGGFALPGEGCCGGNA